MAYEWAIREEENKKFLHMYPVASLHHSLLAMFGGMKETLKDFLVSVGVISEDKNKNITRNERKNAKKSTEALKLRLSKKAREAKEYGG